MKNKIYNEFQDMGIIKKVPITMFFLEKVPSSRVQKIVFVKNKKYRSNQMVCLTFYKPIF